MTDQTNNLPISDPLHVLPVFTNQLVGSGFLNGVVNVTLAVAQFTPKDDGTVTPDLTICSRLRFDLVCAMQVRDALNAIIEQNTKPSNGEKVN